MVASYLLLPYFSSGPIDKRITNLRGSTYHCKPDLLLITCGFSCFAYVERTTVLLAW